MKATTIAGLVLVVLGITALIYQGFSYKDEETVLDLGGIRATAAREKTVPIHPAIGAAAVVGGVILILAGKGRAHRPSS